MEIVDLSGAATWDECVLRVRTAVRSARPGDWIFGRGWHQEKWAEPPAPSVDGAPLHDALSAVSPDNPVSLGHASGHAIFVNAAALALAGIDATTPDPPGGAIVRDSEGRPTGLLRESAEGLVRAAIAAWNETRPSQERAADYRIVPLGNDFLAVRSIKRMIDGALGSHGAWLLEPYSDRPESTGLVLDPPDSIEETGRIAIRHGFQLATHAIGDRANREVLDLYERLFRESPGLADPRFRIEHAQHLDPRDVPRFAALGVIASMQGVHASSDGPWLAQRLGGERAGRISYVWRSLLDAGALVTNGSDVPVEDVDPIASFHASVTRRMPSGESFHGEQSMTRMEALRSYTRANAFAAFDEQRVGTLTPGKLADITVLSKDITAIPEDEIPTAQVVYTIVGGKVVFSAPAP
jgi:predicted amidohydrolase YtcJ